MEVRHPGNLVNETLQFPLAEEFEKDLTAALDAAAEVDTVVLAMIDMDGCHPMNQRFGWEVGDQLLIQTGEHLRAHLPKGGRLYRYAGDEFALLFPEGMEKEDAFLAMEAMRASYPVQSPEGEPQTITIGLAAAPEDGARYADLLRKAEGALHRGKVGGRNRVCLAREEKMVTKTSHYTVEQLQRLTKLSKREGIGEAILLREALDALLRKYDV